VYALDGSLYFECLWCMKTANSTITNLPQPTAESLLQLVYVRHVRILDSIKIKTKNSCNSSDEDWSLLPPCGSLSSLATPLP
jgi:hypothetical protein